MLQLCKYKFSQLRFDRLRIELGTTFVMNKVGRQSLNQLHHRIVQIRGHPSSIELYEILYNVLFCTSVDCLLKIWDLPVDCMGRINLTSVGIIGAKSSRFRLTRASFEY